MNTHAFDPIVWKYSGDFDVRIDEKGAQYHAKLNYTGKAIEIIGIAAESLSTTAQFTEIKNSIVKKIDVKGSLYLHDCFSEIEEVLSTEDIFLHKCVKVKRVAAERDVFILAPLPKDEIMCRCERVEAKRDVTQYFNEMDEFIIESGSMPCLNINANFKRVRIVGDCSEVSKIVFKGNKNSSYEKTVIVNKGALFNGEVIGGKLIFET